LFAGKPIFMKKIFTLGASLLLVFYSFCQLTVTTNPSSSTICSGNSVSITASATPVSYTSSTITFNPYDPTLYTTNVLVDDNTGTYTGMPNNFTALSTGNLDDGRWDNIALPFSFRFYGNIFNSIHITTNGWIGMGSTNSISTGLGATIPAAGLPNDVIHAITTDLTFSGNVPANNTTTTAALQYFTVGTIPNRKFVVDFSALKFLSAAGTAGVQVILYETTNVIEIHTASCTNTTKTKSQGIENGTGTVGTAVTGRNNTSTWSAAANTAYRFTPDVINYTWSPSATLNTAAGATVIATPTGTTTYTVNATNASNGQTGSANVTVTINPSSFTLAGTAGGAQVCQNITVSSSGTSYRDGTCTLIATLLPTGGGTALTNSVNTCVKVENTAGAMGTSNLYLARHYDAEPIVNAATATANVTLYYLQSEFNNYNTLAGSYNQKLLPSGPSDVTGISNVMIRQFHGTGTNPTNYTGASADFTNATAGFSVTWNATRNWWEVVVPVNGFSGFYITTAPAGVLPVTLEYFKASQTDNLNKLSWKVNCTSAKVNFEIERSSDGRSFTTITTLTADRLRCNQPFDTDDNQPPAGLNYYRIKITDDGGKFYYSNIIILANKAAGFEIERISPNPVMNENAVLKINAGEKSVINIIISDISGKNIAVQTATIIAGKNQITLNTRNLTGGTYIVTVSSGSQSRQSVKLVKL
jgi:Secretion system C-terminal sorting domain